MQKRTSSKITSYIKPKQPQFQNQESMPVGDDAFNDMAKSLLSQGQSSRTPQQPNSQEVVVLLRKINTQLENLQQSLTGNQCSGEYQQPAQNQQWQQSFEQLPSQSQQQAVGQQAENNVSQELKNLFSMLLQNGSQKTDLSLGEQAQDQNNRQVAKASMSNNMADATAAQEVLAQAQYELSDQLEASLKKLKQVLGESEKIANNISSLIEQKNSQ